MADISALGNLQPSEPLDLSMYADVKTGFTLPEKGEYTVRAPESFPPTVFGQSQSGSLKAQIDPTIVGPTGEGLVVKFTNISAKTYKRGGMTVSQLGDYLRACGRREEVPGDPQAQADLIESTAGSTYQVLLDWRARNSATGFTVEGMENFPIDPKTGKRQSWIEDPGAKGEDGKPLRLRANLIVRKFIPAN